MISITKHSGLPGESSAHHPWGTVPGLPCTSRFAGWVQTSPVEAAARRGLGPTAPGRGSQGSLNPGGAAGCRVRVTPSVGQRELLLSRAVWESSKGFAVAEAGPYGKRVPGMPESLPGGQRGAGPILTPLLSVAGCSGTGWHVRRVLSCQNFYSGSSTALWGHLSKGLYAAACTWTQQCKCQPVGQQADGAPYPSHPASRRGIRACE